ncbi:hypothetical protein BD324DRAFT_623930 [Kockovaella imperatae]|uniref:Galactose-binding domain-like protein n=1 Tax=Kockovaella imperatae TaxID=4999 RepID=A0A1Y1UIT7_9TREE|nr:hypothetical protein BD324DRAFT_623930 [Kockovaella imperatae]ORX37951.1 hypothetical protein BD324DRAFT_623930 [Kockovaella imperatae]
MQQSLRNVLPPRTKVSLSGASSSSLRKSLIDSQNETPWTAPSLPASIHLRFSEPTDSATHIALTFQGGFVGTKASLYLASRGQDGRQADQPGLELGGKIYPEDKNKRQIFQIPYLSTTNNTTSLTELKIEFETSSDQYGRITLYSVELLG